MFRTYCLNKTVKPGVKITNIVSGAGALIEGLSVKISSCITLLNFDLFVAQSLWAVLL